MLDFSEGCFKVIYIVLVKAILAVNIFILYLVIVFAYLWLLFISQVSQSVNLLVVRKRSALLLILV